MIKLDPWQKEIIEAKGNLCICSGRQTGKSQCIAQKAVEYCLNNPRKQVLIISVTEDQAILLLQKCLLYIEEKNPRAIKQGKSRPTKSKLELKNDSIIRTKAVGQSGLGARGFTINMLIADEAAFMPDDVWAAVTPMLLTTGGDIILISTPHGKSGYFYQCFNDENFKRWHLNSEEVVKNREICPTWKEIQKDKAIGFLEAEKRRMSIREYGQEYLGQFIDELCQFYSDEVIRRSMIYQRSVIGKEGRDFYLGCDLARMGGDETTFEIVERKDEQLYHRENIVWKYVRLSEITEKILQLDTQYNFKRIYLDDGGIGVGVFDSLLSNPQTKKKTIALNNSQRIIEYNIDKTPKKKKLLKEDLHNNLLQLMEKGKILLLDDSNIWLSFKSIQYEYLNEKGGATMRIFGDNSHIVEGIVRAAWCIKDKLNKVRFSYI
jgi:hypothetical protein